MNDLECMIAIIHRKNTFRKYTDDANVWHARERHHMPYIHTILEVNGTQGISAGWSVWYFDADGRYLACGFDG